MPIEEIKQNIYPEDRMMAAVAAECHYQMVNHVLDGSRGYSRGKGKIIYEFLKAAAIININAYSQKDTLANKLKSEI